MIQWLTLWWHRRVLGHLQVTAPNDDREPGVACWTRTPNPVYPRCLIPCRWFPADGGRGR